MTRQRYQLQIETASGVGQDESTRRLRTFLKMALRCYGIKCTSAERIKHGSQGADEDDAQQTIGGERDECDAHDHADALQATPGDDKAGDQGRCNGVGDFPADRIRVIVERGIAKRVSTATFRIGIQSRSLGPLQAILTGVPAIG